MATQINREYVGLISLLDSCAIAMGLSEELPVSILRTFLAVCIWGGDDMSREPLKLQDLAERINAPVTTVSRHLRYLGDWERLGVPGMGLVRTDIYPLNRRQKVASLTPKGELVAAQMRKAIERTTGYGHKAEQGGQLGG